MDDKRADNIDHAAGLGCDAPTANTEPTGDAGPGRHYAPPQGTLSSVLRAMFLKRLTVAAAEELGGRFYRVTLESPELRAVKWNSGMKAQIAMASAFVTRTYTPTDWNAKAGTMRIIGYAHGDGPGSDWLRSVRQGDQCDVFGPRNTLNAGRLSGSIAVVGDETSVGLLHSLRYEYRARKAQAILEVGDVESARAVVNLLGLDDTRLVERAADESHLTALQAHVAKLAADNTVFILTGKSQSIQRMLRMLKASGVPGNRILTKAYWAPGKTGLD